MISLAAVVAAVVAVVVVVVAVVVVVVVAFVAVDAATTAGDSSEIDDDSDDVAPMPALLALMLDVSASVGMSSIEAPSGDSDASTANVVVDDTADGAPLCVAALDDAA